MNKKIIGVTVGTPISPSKFLDEHLAGVDEALDGILNLQELFKNGGGSIYGIAGKIYPIGSIYMSVNDTSPASLFGGEWERLEGRFLLGAGEIKEYNKNGTQTDEDGNNYDVFTYNAGSTGGSAYAVLVEHYHEVPVRGNITGSEITGGYANIVATALGRNSAIQTSITGTSAGEKGTGKNMPPYLAVYMWKRTA